MKSVIIVQWHAYSRDKTPVIQSQMKLVYLINRSWIVDLAPERSYKLTLAKMLSGILYLLVMTMRRRRRLCTWAMQSCHFTQLS